MNFPQERTIIVTGGSSGVGKAIAAAFLEKEHAQVIIIGRAESRLRAVCAELGSGTHYRQADVGKRRQVTTAVAGIIKRFGKIDALINCAGIVRSVSPETPLAEAEKAWGEVMETNLKGSFLMAMAVIPHLARPGGRIINISSIAAFTGGKAPGGTIAYAASKSGLHGLTYALAKQLGPEGITVNAIASGTIENTGITGRWPPGLLDEIRSRIPAGRLGRAEDIAAAATFLASPEASYINGEILNVNGGWLFGR